MTLWTLGLMAMPATALGQDAHAPRTVLTRAPVNSPDWGDVPVTLTGPVTCVAKVAVRADGWVAHVAATGCPQAYAAEAVSGLKRWRWSASEQRSSTEVTVPFRAPGVRFQDAMAGLGSLVAPENASIYGLDPTQALARFLWWRTLVGPIVVGANADVRGFNTFGAHGQIGVGVPIIAPGRAQVALVSGVGLSAREQFREPAAVGLWIPIHTLAGITLTNNCPTGRSRKCTDVGLIARGGVNVGIDRFEYDVEPLAHEAVLGVVVGQGSRTGVTGVRIEAGWRREWLADTVTVVFGLGG